MKRKMQILLNGIFKENPVLILVLGCCSALAISVTVLGSLGMGAALTFVLVGSNIVISALRKVIPDKVRIPCYIVLIAGFVTAVELLLHAFVPSLYDSLGIYLAPYALELKVIFVIAVLLIGYAINRRREQQS